MLGAPAASASALLIFADVNVAAYAKPPSESVASRTGTNSLSVCFFMVSVVGSQGRSPPGRA